MIIGDPDNMDNNFCAYIGEAYQDDEIKQEISVLKGSQVVEQIKGQPININTILRAMEILADKGEKQLMKRFPTVTVTAGDPTPKFGTPLFCESPILSIANPGKKYQAIQVEKGAAPELTVEELRAIIDTCAAFMDVKSAIGKGPAFRRALQRITSRLEETHVNDIVQLAIADSAL